MKKALFTITLIGFLAFIKSAAFCAETFDVPYAPPSNEETVSPQEPEADEQPAQIQEDKTTKRKFFSILEKNKDEEIKETKSDKQDSTAASEDASASTRVLVDSDTIEYFPERHEFEALGNARVTFPEQNSVLTADKIIFNHDSNYIKAYDNVEITRDKEKIFGDYVHINLNEDNALITSPVMAHVNIQIKAKKGAINKARVEATEGSARFTDSGIFKLNARSLFGFENPLIDEAIEKNYFIKDKYNNEWNLRSKVIIIDSYKDRDIITLEDSDIFLQDLKIGSAGKVKIYTNKEQQYVETNLLELGSIRNLGAFVAPSYVFKTPFSSTLKAGPMLNYDDSELGFGGMARFQNGHNRTEAGYSTARDKIVVRGKHYFTDKIWAQYGMNSYMDEWWLGGRMPEYGAQLVYSQPYKMDDLRLTFTNRFTAGFFEDWGERNFSTTRFRWQTSTEKGLYEYVNSDKQFAAKFGLSLQTNASLYGTGDTFGLVRFGPTLRTQYRGWQQYIAYYQGGTAGDSPFWFDKFFYGKSSVMIGESLRINKYLTLLYSTSLALSSTPDDKMLQENRFYLLIGPDDFKVLVGYDAYRKNTTFGINMAVGTENSEVQFNKLILNEPENFGKSDKRKKEKPVSDKKEKETNPMDRSVKEYDGYNPGFGALNNLIQPGIRPPGY